MPILVFFPLRLRAIIMAEKGPMKEGGVRASLLAGKEKEKAFLHAA